MEASTDSLPYDVLWAVLSSIASDLNVHVSSRLSETIRNTHVCREWRHIILQSPSIWGKLLLVNNDKNSHNWMPVALQRSGSSALWIEGDVFTGRRGQYDHYAEFFYRMMDENWERIERLDVRIYGQAKAGYYGSNSQIRSVLQRPAPMLRTFILDNRTTPIEADDDPLRCSRPLLPLFSDHAPNLHEFGTNFGSFNNLTCLSNLRSLYTSRRSTYTSTVRQLLDVLATTPLLDSLAVYHDIVEELHPFAYSPPLRTVNLPFLSKLVLHTTARNCLGLLDSIKPSPNGCLVACNASIDPWEANLESTLKELRRLYKTIMDEHFRLAHSYCSNSKIKPLKSLELHIMDTLVLLNDACSILPGNENSFKLSLSWHRWVSTTPLAYPGWFFPAICSLFSFEQLKNVTQLRLALFDEHITLDLVPDYRPLLNSFSSVKYLEMDIISFNFLYQTLACRAENDDGSLIVFPNLAVLRICEHRRPSESHMPAASKIVDNLVRFIRNRGSNVERHFIKVLDLAFDIEEKDINQLLRSLDEVNLSGLRVCWWQDGKAGFRVIG